MIGDRLLDRAARAARRRANQARSERAWDAAATDYRRYLSRYPDDAAIWVQLGHMLGESGLIGEADHAYDTAEQLRPGDADLALCRGYLAQRHDDIEGARTYYLRSLEIDGNERAATALATLPPEPVSEHEPEAAEPEEATSALPDEAEHEISVMEEESAQPEPAAEPEPEPEPARTGRFEGWWQRSVSGFLVAEPGSLPVVEFRVDGLVVGRARARIRREKPSEHGFSAMLDIDSESAIVSAHRLPDGAELDNSPILLHPRPPMAGGSDTPAWAVRSVVAKPFAMPDHGEVALFVAHTPMGKLKPHVAPYLAMLKAQGIATLLVVVTDRPADLPPAILDSVAGAMVRENIGYDFAAWSHALKVHPELFGAKLLLLLNDSVMVASDTAPFDAVMDRVRRSPAHLVGLTESHEYNWHAQTFFLACKAPLLSSWSFQRFFENVRLLGSKDEVIRAYEVPFARHMEGHGHPVEILFESHLAINPSLFGWRELIQAGFPFVKLLLLRGLFPEADIEGWRDFLGRAGFDIALIDATVAAADEHAPVGGDPGLLARPVRLPADGVQPPLKIAFFGPWNYDNGLGSASRGILNALRRTGARLNIHPIHKPFHVHRPLAPPVDMIDFEGVPDIAIVHLNPDSWHLLTDDQIGAIRSSHRRIGYWVWEMGHLPPAWRHEFGSVERIWSPSTYCAEMFERESGVPVDIVPHPVPVPGRTNSDRAVTLSALGIDPAKRVLLYVFDGSSYLVRKNPAALVRAFAASGLAARGWTLVLKTKHLMDRPEEGAAFAELANGTEGVCLLDRSLDATGLSALLAAADIYASPHCSEGFGLTIAEAMAAGKPVVATDFSGSRDYLDANCGYPVRAHRWVLAEDHGHYTEGGEWARIDEPALAHALDTAAKAVEAGDTRIGDAARARIAEQLSLDAVAERIKASFAAALKDHGGDRLPIRFESDVALGTRFADADFGENVTRIALSPEGALAAPLPADLPTDVDHWIALAPEDSLAAPAFAGTLLDHAARRPDVAIFYADDVAIGADRPIDQLRLKPAFDVALLAAQDYVGWPVMVRASALATLGGLDARSGTAVLTDLLFRAHAAGLSIERLPEVLLAHRGERPRARAEDRKRALAVLPAFRGMTIEDGLAPSLLSLSREFGADAPPVSLLIPTRGSTLPESDRTYIERLLDGIARADWPMDCLTVIVGDDGAGQPGWSRRKWPFKLRRIATPRAEGERFNYAAKMNRLWREAEDEQIVFLNDDLDPRSPGWLKALQTFAVEESVGGVGARLYYEDGRLQHAGIAPIMSAVAHLWLGREHIEGSYQDWALAQREWSMVTGAVFATRRSLMDRAGGFDEAFSLEFNDIDLCLRLRALGYRIVYDPDAEFTHAEKASRGDVSPPGEEMALFTSRWRQFLNADPAFHPLYRRDRLDLLPHDIPDAWYR